MEYGQCITTSYESTKGGMPAQSDVLLSPLRSFLVQRQRATNTATHDLADPDRSPHLFSLILQVSLPTAVCSSREVKPFVGSATTQSSLPATSL